MNEKIRENIKGILETIVMVVPMIIIFSGIIMFGDKFTYLGVIGNWIPLYVGTILGGGWLYVCLRYIGNPSKQGKEA